MAGVNADETPIVNLVELAQSDPPLREPWSYQGEELNANLIHLAAGEGVAEHRNDEVEVLLVGVDGEGIVEINERRHVLQTGYALFIPRGARRSIRAGGGHVAYLSCRRRRVGLSPSPASRSERG